MLISGGKKGVEEFILPEGYDGSREEEDVNTVPVCVCFCLNELEEAGVG